MKKKSVYILSFIVIIAGLITILAVVIRNRNNDNFNIVKAEMGNISRNVEETGTVFSRRVNTFYSDVSQRVKVVNVSIGDRVKKGDVILTYENNYDLEIERANKQIESITATYNESSKGADFQKVSNEKLNINTIEINLEYAKKNLDKIKNLFENNAVSQAEYEEAENNVKALENQLQEAQNNYEILVKGVSSNVKKQYEAQIGEIMVQINILENYRRQSSVIAEFDGIITELNVSQGSMTQPGVVVTEIQEENNLGIYVELLADEAYEVQSDMPFVVRNQITKEVIEELKVNKIHPKALSKISDLGVEQKRVRAEAYIDKNKNNLKIGSEVAVEIILEHKENVLLLEKDAVYEISGKKYVTLMNGGNKEEREVITGISDDKNIEIISGLSENDQVLAD